MVRDVYETEFCAKMSGQGVNNINDTNDILQLIPDEKLPLLKNIFKNNWPYAVQAYIFVDYWIKCKQKKPNIGIKFTSPEGRWQDGTFVAIVTDFTYNVYFFSLASDYKSLIKALKDTKLINWSEGPYICAVHEDQDLYLKNSLSTVGLVQFDIESTCWFLSKDIAKNYTVQIPNDVYISFLTPHHGEQINSIWPHKFPGSESYLKNLITLNGGLGIFTKTDNLLCSWIMVNDFGAIAILQTLEKYKRKGFAAILVKLLAKKLALNDTDSITYIVRKNIISQTLFKSLGFRLNNNVRWIQYKKITVDDNVLSHL